jgi:hypothetical protein
VESESGSLGKKTKRACGFLGAAATPRFFFLALLLVAPALCRAADRCPWLTAGTASGLLDSDAVGTFAAAAAGQPAVCVFTSDAQGAKRTLRITVETTPDAHARVMAASQACGRDQTPLKAIGNEAVACAADDRNSQAGERAVGRVRDQVFTIEIESSVKNDADLTRDALKEKIYTAAEQVAGNLF